MYEVRTLRYVILSNYVYGSSITRISALFSAKLSYNLQMFYSSNVVDLTVSTMSVRSILRSPSDNALMRS